MLIRLSSDNRDTMTNKKEGNLYDTEENNARAACPVRYK